MIESGFDIIHMNDVEMEYKKIMDETVKKSLEEEVKEIRIENRFSI